jgi:Ca2+-transporting ATPase
LVASGRGWAAVTGVQGATELGRLGSSLASVEPPLTRLQRHTRRLSSRLTIWALGLCAGLAVLQEGLSGDWPRFAELARELGSPCEACGKSKIMLS